MSNQYVYRQTERNPALFTVGFYEGSEWFPAGDYSKEGDARDRVHYLKGGNLPGNLAELHVGQLIPIEQLELAHINAVIAKTETLEEAARILGIDIATLYRKRKRHGLIKKRRRT